ncbi:hypothetical protein HK100_012921 [Physocladia obscura]|uniref:Uncharacterized protein n=1 Tax=Physocladia obscura TaxID=109957 RepID=A0AAD5SZ26_9FUNG|nr:hypothetical protein HK100_012921 [Physocladia obscura]
MNSHESSNESITSNGSNGGRFSKMVTEIGKKLSRRQEKDTLVDKNILKEETVSPSIVQNKIAFEKERQQDALNRKLEMRPSKVDLKLRNILKPGDSNDSLYKSGEALDFDAKAAKLKSCLKKRPSRADIEGMNLLHNSAISPTIVEKQRRLSRSMVEDSLGAKLRVRPDIDELAAKNIVFCETVEVLATFRKSEYNRRPDGDVTFKHLTPQLKVAIRNELNVYKQTEMDVHEEAS